MDVIVLEKLVDTRRAGRCVRATSSVDAIQFLSKVSEFSSGSPTNGLHCVRKFQFGPTHRSESACFNKVGHGRVDQD